LKVKLAYVEQERALELEKLIHEQKMEELKLKRDLELSRAKLNVFKEIESSFRRQGRRCEKIPAIFACDYQYY